MVVSAPGTIQLPLLNNSNGMIKTNVSADGIEAQWFYDTGAPFSVVCESFAQSLHLRLLPGTAHEPGSTEVQNIAHMAMLETLQIGSEVLSHVPIIVLSDDALKAGRITLDAVVGYPVMRVIGSFTISRDSFSNEPLKSSSAQATGCLLEFGPIPLLSRISRVSRQTFSLTQVLTARSTPLPTLKHFLGAWPAWPHSQKALQA